MQAVIDGIAAVNWSGHLSTGWNWAQAQSATSYAFLLALPSSCKVATLHAAFVCTGHSTDYVAAPGFAPLRYAWGWILVGLFIGSALTTMVLAFTGLLRRQPTISTLATIAQMPQQRAVRPQAAPALRAPPGLPRAREQVMAWGNPQVRAREDVLAYLVAGGRPALEELATASGLTDSEFLLTAFGLQGQM